MPIKKSATVAINDQGVITITGVAKGDANITVSATDVEAVTIVASVTEDAPTTVDITLDNIEDLTVKAGKQLK
jgi:arginine/ornithine N-succinyltransferase beta subunit